MVKNWKKYHTESNDVCIVFVKEGGNLVIDLCVCWMFFFTLLVGRLAPDDRHGCLSYWDFPIISCKVPNYRRMSFSMGSITIDEWTHGKERAIGESRALRDGYCF